MVFLRSQIHYKNKQLIYFYPKLLLFLIYNMQIIVFKKLKNPPVASLKNVTERREWIGNVAS